MLSVDQLYIASGVMIGVCSVYALQVIKTSYASIKAKIDNNRAYKKKIEEVKQYKSEGNLHRWITLSVSTSKGVKETNVCSETGYCPLVEGFVPLNEVKHMVEMQKQTKDFEAFRESEKKRIQDKFSIWDADIDELFNDFYSIKKNFHVKLMNESIASLREKLGDDVLVTDLDKLQEAMSNDQNS